MNNEDLQGILDATGLAVWEYDFDISRYRWSSALRGMLGYAPAAMDLALDAWLALIHPDDQSETQAALARAAAAGNDPFTAEYRLRKNDGGWLWVHARGRIGRRDAANQPLAAFGFAADVTSRRIVENALRSSEERFARAFLANPAALLIARLSDGRLIDVNDASLELFGRVRREFVGRSLDELQVFEGQGLIERIRDCNPIRHWETRIRNRNGIRNIDISAELIELEDQPCVLAMLFDITERKRTEAALRESQTILEQAQAIGRMGSWSADLATGDLHASKESARLVGWRPDMRTLADFSRIVHPDDAAQVRKTWIAALKSAESYDGEFRIIHDGQIRWLHIRGSLERDAQGWATRAVGMAQDVTEARRVRHTLEEYQTHLEDIVVTRTAALAAANHRLQISDRRLQTLFALSQRASEMSERELLQMGINEAVRLTDSEIGYLHEIGGDGQRIELLIWSNSTAKYCRAGDGHLDLTQGGIWADAVRRRAPVMHNDFQRLAPRAGGSNGHPPLSRYLGVPVIEDEQVVMVLGVANKRSDYNDSDIGELQLIGNDLWRIVMRRRTEVALAEAKRSAEAASQAKSFFLANMSHEIRTPLNAVLGFAQIGQRQSAGRKAGELFERIIDSGQHLLGVIDDILDFSKIEAGKFVLEQEMVHLGEVIDRAIEFTAGRAYAKGLDFQIDEAADLPLAFQGDPLRLSQILVNLLSNAIKFTERGRVCLAIDTVHGALVIRVSDEGVGMPEEQIARLFSPFEQADGSTTRRFGGTGLGLAICKNLVDLMGGAIHARSAPGRGSVFEVRLPLTDVRPAEPAEGTAVLYGLPESEALRLSVRLQQRGIRAVRIAADGPLPADAQLIITSSEALRAQRLDTPLLAVIERGQQVAVLHTPGADGVSSALREKSIKLERPQRVRHIVRAMTAQASECDNARANRRLQGISILAAEDNEVNRLVLDEMLGMEGARLICVANGELAVERIRQDGASAYDLVLTDIQMPQMDGYETARQILALAPRLPIIGLTAHAMPEERARCLAAGMVDHIAKPFDLDRLVESILAFTNRNAGRASGTCLPPPTNEALFDPQALAARYRNRTAFIARLLATVQSSAGEMVPQLRQQIEARDFDALRRLAHSLKGMAGNIFADPLRDLAARTEHAASQSQAEALLLAEELAGMTERLLREIEGHAATED